MAITRASLAAIAATACILAAFVGSTDAAMAKITCHCDVGDIEGGFSAHVKSKIGIFQCAHFPLDIPDTPVLY